MNINSRTSKINFTGYASGAIASFTGLREAPIKLKVNATGVSECNVVRCGTNLWDEEWENGYFNRANGTKAGSDNTKYFRSKNYISCLPNTIFYFKMPAVHAQNSTYFAVLFYDKNKTYLDNTIISSITSKTTQTPENAYYMTFYCEVGTTESTYQHDISINYPSTDTQYHTYNGNTYTIPANEFTQIDQIIGVNNIFADTGNVEVYYVTI